MTVRILPHEWGIAIRCDVPACTNVHQTGNCLVGVNRDYASGTGWWFRRRTSLFVEADFCPEHADQARSHVRDVRRKRRNQLASIRRAAKRLAAERVQRDFPPNEHPARHGAS